MDPRTLRRIGLVALALLLSATQARRALAVDGVIEINQAAALAGNVIPGDTPGFPVTITASGSYRLTSNLTVADGNTSVIAVNAANVTLDLNGFAIEGPNVCTGTLPFGQLNCSVTGTGNGIFSGFNNVTVTNGTVHGMGSLAIDLGATVGARVRDVRVSDNSGIGIATGALSDVTHCSASRNKNGGIGVGDQATVTSSESSSNDGAGITCVDTCVATNNSSNNNRGVGIIANQGATILGNAARNNSSYGLQLAANGGYGQNVLTNNNGGEDAPMHPQVLNGIQIGTNLCGTDTTCP